MASLCLIHRRAVKPLHNAKQKRWGDVWTFLQKQLSVLIPEENVNPSAIKPSQSVAKSSLFCIWSPYWKGTLYTLWLVVTDYTIWSFDSKPPPTVINCTIQYTLYSIDFALTTLLQKKNVENSALHWSKLDNRLSLHIFSTAAEKYWIEQRQILQCKVDCCYLLFDLQLH